MSVADVDETVSSSGIWRATCFCISAKPYQRRTSGLRHHRAAATSSTRSRVIGWCTVATTGMPELGDLQQAGAQALVVVHHVEVGEPLGRAGARGAQAERARLGKSGRPHRGEFEQVDPVADLTGPRHPERVGLAVEVQAGHLVQAHPRVEAIRVRLAGEHLDVVAEFDEPAAKVADVDPLAATMCLAPVRQQRNAHVQLTTMRTGGQVQGR